MIVTDLERRLLELLPASAAEPWDRTGMLVGNPFAEVGDIVVALDPSIEAMKYALGRNANVIVTHHPMFLDPPTSFLPPDTGSDAVGSRIWFALANGLSVLSFHTALDANPFAATVLSDPLGLTPTGELLEETPGHAGFGYGRICLCNGRTASDLARSCSAAFGRKPRLWGNPERSVERACLWTGAAGDAPLQCIQRSIDLLICGEVKYHTAIDAIECGLSIIELGHDISEQPHCAVLVKLLEEIGISSNAIHKMELPENWR